MEAAGLALAVTGLAGQAVSGVTSLKAFFAAYKAAPSTAMNLHFELDSLLSTLHEIRQVVQRAREEEEAARNQPFLISKATSSAGAWSKPYKSLLQTLEYRMLSCVDDIDAWEQASKGLSIGVWGDVRTFARKLKIAASKEVFDTIAITIGTHRHAIGNSLTSLTYFTAQDNLSLSRGIQGHLMSLTSTSNLLLASHQTAESAQQQQRSQFSEALAELDTSRRESHSKQMDLLRSMADSISSIASQVASQSSVGSRKPPNSGRGSSPQMGYSPQAYELANQRPPSESDVHQFPKYQKNSTAAGDLSTCPPQAAAVPSPSTAPQVWSCGNVLGIDQLSGETSRCLFCELGGKRQYRYGFFVDTVAFGSHLVENHGFGSCDLDTTYSSARSFAAHVVAYHCSAERIETWMLEKLQCFISNRDKSARAPIELDLSTSLRSPRHPEQEPASTKTLLQTRIRCLLQNQGLLPVMCETDGYSLLSEQKADKDAKDCADTDTIMAALRSLESSTDAESTKTLYSIACLIEEATVSELSQRLSLRNYQSADHRIMTRRAALEAFTTFTSDDNPPRQFMYGHFLTQPLVSTEKCTSCALSAKMMMAYAKYSDLTSHFVREHGMQNCESIDRLLRDRFKELPLHLNPAWFPKFPVDDSLVNRVDRWMLHCFLTSPNWRILLRTHYKQYLARPVESWTADVLQHWQDDSTRSLAHALEELTDGAVNSRDHTAAT